MKDAFSKLKLYFHKPKSYEELRGYALFAELKDYDLFLIWQRMHTRKFRAGETLYEYGYPVEVIYFVFDGEIEITRQSDPDRRTVIGKGRHLGLRDLYYNQERNGTARAKTAATVHTISRNDLNEFFDARPKAGTKILDAICREFGQVIFGDSGS